MDPKKIQASLRQIGKIYSGILDDTSKSIVIPSAVASVKTTSDQYKIAKRMCPGELCQHRGATQWIIVSPSALYVQQ